MSVLVHENKPLTGNNVCSGNNKSTNEILSICLQPSSYKGYDGKRRVNPIGWYWSEKYDGIKARYINGKLYTRAGQLLPAPDSFLAQLPQGNFDGELFLGNQQFFETAALRVKNHNVWQRVKYMIFDLIDFEKTWLERQIALLECIIPSDVSEHEDEKNDKTLSKSNTKQFSLSDNGNLVLHCDRPIATQIYLVQWQEITSIAQLDTEFNRVIQQGGEGLVLADPQGKYIAGHSDCIVKYKAHNDNEAVVTDYRCDENGRLVSLRVKACVQCYKSSNNCKEVYFNIGIGLKNEERYKYRELFPIGSIVSYSFQLQNSQGVPRTPVLRGIRIDSQ
jgi:DNA ligase-1